MADSERTQMADLGYYTPAGAWRAADVDYRQVYWKRDHPTAEVYRSSAASTSTAPWRAIYKPKANASSVISPVFDDPITAAIWLNVELAGE